MLCKILRDFNFSFDGYTEKKAEVDTECDIPDALVEGLAAAGYLVDPTAPVKTKMAATPENKMAPAPANKRRR